MNSALIKLFLLLNKAAFRRSIRGARTVRGAVVLLIGLAVIVFWPLLGLSFLFLKSVSERAHDFGSAGPYLSIYIMFMCIMNILQSSKAPPFYFSPPEVEFLFSGPFHRREILLFKLMSTGV